MRFEPRFGHMILSLASASLLVGVLAGCSSSSSSSTPAGAVKVDMKSFSLTPSATSAKAGDVTFDAKNNATDVQHELIVIKTDVAFDQLTLGSDDRIDEESVNTIGEVSELDPGKSGTVTLKLDAGKYVLVCNIAGHYRQGMRAAFTVNP